MALIINNIYYKRQTWMNLNLFYEFIYLKWNFEVI